MRLVSLGYAKGVANETQHALLLVHWLLPVATGERLLVSHFGFGIVLIYIYV